MTAISPATRSRDRHRASAIQFVPEIAAAVENLKCSSAMPPTSCQDPTGDIRAGNVSVRKDSRRAAAVPRLDLPDPRSHCVRLRHMAGALRVKRAAFLRHLQNGVRTKPSAGA